MKCKGDFQSTVTFYFLIQVIVPQIFYLLSSKIKLQNTEEDPSEVKRQDTWSPGSLGPKIKDIQRKATCLLKTYQVEESHSKEQFSNSSQAHPWRDNSSIKKIENFLPLHSSLMVLFSIAHIPPFKFFLTHLFYETYLLITHICTSASRK